MYGDQIPGATLTICMLRADPNMIKERFLQRGWKPHLVDDAIHEVAELEQAKFADIRVDTVDHSVKEIAQIVRAQAGNWPGTRAQMNPRGHGFE